jgi:hypothetical protein
MAGTSANVIVLTMFDKNEIKLNGGQVVTVFAG